MPSGEGLNEIRGLVEVVRDYTPPSDWGSNLFAGIVYFALGDKDEAVTCVEYGNVKPGRETEISGAFLAFMKREKDIAVLPPKVLDLYENMLMLLPREELVKEAQSGNLAAQLTLGNICRDEKNYDEAVKWWSMTGYSNVQNNLGNMYLAGNGVRQNYSEAIRRYRKAAEQGYAHAQFNLGVMYHNGYGVMRNYTEAVKWYRKAAEQGSIAAKYWLEYMRRKRLQV